MRIYRYLFLLKLKELTLVVSKNLIYYLIASYRNAMPKITKPSSQYNKTDKVYKSTKSIRNKVN